MPRIYDSRSDPLDFCQDCMPSEAQAQEEYGDLGDGPDKRGNCFGYEAEHPDYDGEDYNCTECGKRLRTEDN